LEIRHLRRSLVALAGQAYRLFVVIRVLLVADVLPAGGRLADLLVREGDIAVVGQVDIESDVAESAVQSAPQVVLVDTDYMVSQVLPMVGDLRTRHPGCAVLVLSDPSKRGMLPPRRRAAGMSFLLKGTPVSLLAHAIRRIAAGEQVIDPRLLMASMDTEKEVTTREWEVLGLAAQGESVADIARRLYLSLGTVRNHLSSVIAKTGARNRLDAIRIARKQGWLR
jgi:two-component system response regulator DesR